jgi:hypothetical protein
MLKNAFDFSLHTPLILGSAPLLGLLAEAVVQLIVCRTAWRLGLLRIQFIGIGIGLGVTIGLLILLFRYLRVSLAASIDYFALYVFSYAFLAFCLFNLINSSIGSLRVRMIREYLKHYPIPLSIQTLCQIYSAKDMVRVRLERMLIGKQIEANNGRYFARKRLVSYIGTLFSFLQKLLLKEKYRDLR